MKWTRTRAWIIGSVAGLAALLCVAVVLAAYFVDPNDYKREIEALARESLGRELNLDGDVGLSFFPGIGVRLAKVSLAGLPEAGSPPLAEAGAIRLVVRIVPLFWGDVRIKRVELTGLRLNLLRDSDGRANWEGLGAGGDESKDSGADDSAEAVEEALLAVGAVSVRDAEVVFDDRKDGLRFAVSGLNLSTGSFEPARPVDVKLSFKAESENPGVGGDVSLTAQVSANEDFSVFHAGNVEAKATAAGDGLFVKSLSARLTGGLDYDLVRGTFGFSNAVLACTGSDVRGVTAVESLSATMAWDGVLDPESAGFFTGKGRMDLRAGGGRFPEGGLEAALDFDLGKGDARPVAGNMTASFGKGSLRAGLAGSLGPDGDVSGRLDAAGLDIRALLGAFGLDPGFTDPAALTSFDGSTGLRITTDSLELDGLSLDVDGSVITGRAAVRSLRGRSYAFDLSAGSLNLDRYLAFADESANGGAEGTGEKSGESGSPLDVLRTMKLDGRLHADLLVWNRLRMENVELSVTADGGRISLTPVKVSMYRGAVAGGASLDLGGGEFRAGVRGAASGVDAGPFLQALTGERGMEGSVNLTTDLRAGGRDWARMLRTMNGTASFTVRDGVFPGVDFLGLAENALLSAKGEKEGGKTPGASSGGSSGGSTRFGELSGTVAVSNGVAVNRDLSLKSPGVRMAGEGSVDLATEKVDYDVFAKLTANLEGQSGAELEDVWGLPVPIHVGGTLSHPVYTPDIPALVFAMAKGAVMLPVDTATGILKDVGRGVGSALGVTGTESGGKDSDDFDPIQSFKNIFNQLTVEKIFFRRAFKNGEMQPSALRRAVPGESQG